MSTLKPDVSVDFSDGSVDITTLSGRFYRIELVNDDTLRVWAPNGAALGVVPRSSNVVEVVALNRAEGKGLGL